MKRLVILTVAVILSLSTWAGKSYEIQSPDGTIKVTVKAEKNVTYSISKNAKQLILPSDISMQLENGKTFGIGSKLTHAKKESRQGSIRALFYKKQTVEDNYNSLTLQFKEKFNIIFRVYDEGVAYRFVSTGKQEYKVINEQADFNFAQDWKIWNAYVNENGDFNKQYWNSFESVNNYSKISEMNSQKLSFLPILVDAADGIKISVTEADNENYPGMYLYNASGKTSLKANFAPYPKEEKNGGHNNLEEIIVSRENYIAPCKAGTKFPWRIISISTQDKELLNNDMVYRLASPSRLQNTDWIKPGKVAWDWWNNWGIYNVPFKTGVNTETYKAYIDFASKKGIEYVILDEGWAVNKKADLFQIVPEIDLKEIIRYATNKNVGIILWAGCYAFDRDMEHVCKHYSEMGVKGFKVDFMNRDDAKMVEFHRRAAEMGAKYHLLMDFHGTYKPTGLNRTYPNVLNFEGVKGQEQNKWSSMESYNQVQYDVEVPFLRMLAGQMDYTQGAMLNGTKSTYRPNNSEPMSQGTRCHQLGEYVVFFSPLNMLCDSPTHYEKETECTDFIASIPVIWDETVALDSKVGEYVAVARRSGSTWYVGGLTNWTARDITLDLSFIGKDNNVEAYLDGPNAAKFAQDYAKTSLKLNNGKLNIHMAPGGGFALKIK